MGIADSNVQPAFAGGTPTPAYTSAATMPAFLGGAEHSMDANNMISSGGLIGQYPAKRPTSNTGNRVHGKPHRR